MSMPPVERKNAAMEQTGATAARARVGWRRPEGTWDDGQRAQRDRSVDVHRHRGFLALMGAAGGPLSTGAPAPQSAHPRANPGMGRLRGEEPGRLVYGGLPARNG